jgi:hypothetical protein
VKHLPVYLLGLAMLVGSCKRQTPHEKAEKAAREEQSVAQGQKEGCRQFYVDSFLMDDTPAKCLILYCRHENGSYAHGGPAVLWCRPKVVR